MAGSGGIGVTAIQLAAEFAPPWSSPRSAAWTRPAPASGSVPMRRSTTTSVDFAEEIKRLTAYRGVDVILDMVGAPYVVRNIASLKRGGRLLMIAFLQGSTVAELDLLPIMVKRLTVTGSTMRPRSGCRKGRGRARPAGAGMARAQ